jgi:hypothetical protein
VSSPLETGGGGGILACGRGGGGVPIPTTEEKIRNLFTLLVHYLRVRCSIADSIKNAALFFLSLRMHVFGHIHEAYGIHVEQNILFINAACLGELELIQHEPVVVGKCDNHIGRKRPMPSFTPECSVADPGSGAFVTPGSGMGKKS